MKQTINLNQFIDAFHRMERGNQFSYEGLEVLFNSLEEFEEDTDQEMELDVIELCCEYAEMTPQEIIRDYQLDIVEDGNELNNVMDCINDMTWLIGETPQGTIVFRQF